VERRNSEGRQEKTPGELLATVRFADTRWLPGDWTKVLLVFERCLVYSEGLSGEFLGRSLRAGLNPLNVELVTRSTSRWYDERVAADANRALSELVAAHPGNWIVWSTDVVEWDLRAGIGASRLRLVLVDGVRRKVLWGRISNSLPPIRAALHRASPPPPAGNPLTRDGTGVATCASNVRQLDKIVTPSVAPSS
jgi:hypothetical protein